MPKDHGCPRLRLEAYIHDLTRRPSMRRNVLPFDVILDANTFPGSELEDHFDGGLEEIRIEAETLADERN